MIKLGNEGIILSSTAQIHHIEIHNIKGNVYNVKIVFHHRESVIFLDVTEEQIKKLEEKI